MLRTLFTYYRWDLVLAVVLMALVGWFFSPALIFPLLLVCALEITLSGDNAVVNAKVLVKMSNKWQRIFLTVGLLIAVVGMRFVFPILIVSLTAGLGFGEVINLAFTDVHTYGVKLHDAHGEIAMLGGVFLLLVFLHFMFEDREIKWLHPLERFLAKGENHDALAYLITSVAIMGISFFLPSDERFPVMFAGFISMTGFMAVNIFAAAFEPDDDEEDLAKYRRNVVQRVGWAAFALFMYLEFQDASFSFDGVSGAFAITDNIVIITAGLAIGASAVRSMTIHLVRTNSLTKYVYLEHGAHWAIGSLAICQLASIYIDIPEIITGLTGIVFIAIAIWWSKREEKQNSLMQAHVLGTNVAVNCQEN